MSEDQDSCRSLAGHAFEGLPRSVLQWWPGGFSLRDLGADAVGTAAALALLAASEYAWRPRARRRLTFDDGDMA